MSFWVSAHLTVFTKQERSGMHRERSDVVPFEIAVYLGSNVQRAAKIDAATKKCLLCTSGIYFGNETSCVRSVRLRPAKNCWENGQNIIQYM
jgi:hypothetical protein